MNFEKIRFTWRSGKSAFFPKTQENSFQETGENLCKSPRAKKAGSPGPSPDQVAFSLVIFVIALVGTFVFVWYTALKRNL